MLQLLHLVMVLNENDKMGLNKGCKQDPIIRMDMVKILYR